MQEEYTPDVPTKQCCQCEKQLPVTSKYFHRKSDAKDGFRNICKKCRSENEGFKYVKPASDGNKICPGCDHEKPATTEFFSVSSGTKDGFQAHCKACVAARHSRWSKHNPGVMAEKSRKFRDDHPGKDAESARKYVAAHPEARRLTSNRRRALVVSAQGNHTANDIRLQYKAQRGKCYYCNCKLDKKYHVDHIIPLARGGSNGPENIACACPRCNLSKGNKLPTEWDGSNRLL